MAAPVATKRAAETAELAVGAGGGLGTASGGGGRAATAGQSAVAMSPTLMGVV